MNRHKIVWGAALIALLGMILGGCSKELARGGKGEVPGLPETGQAVTFTVTTGVETYAVPAQDYEKSISTLQAILFDGNGVYVTSGTPVPAAQGSTSYTLPIATTGSYKMLLVANYTIPAGSLTGKSLSDVRAILVDNEPGMPNAFVMASTTISDFTVTTGAMTSAGTINLERLAARIDVQSTLDKLTLSKITVKNRKTQSSLLAASSTNAYRTDGKEYGTFERFRKTVTDASMGQIYTYENSAASASSADGTSLVIETAYNGYAVKPLEVKLPQLKRNYIYSIQLMMGDEGFVPDPSDNPDPSKIKLTYNVRVVDWNNGQTFTVSEEDLLKIFKEGAVSYSYNFAVTTTPDISKGVSADGGAAVINATATKQKLVGGMPDPTAPAETITGGDKFTYKVVGNPAPWITISPAGAITVSANTTNASRAATIEIALKEDPSRTTYLPIMQLGKAVTPTTTHTYALNSVSPATIDFESTAGSRQLALDGTYSEMQNGQLISSRALTFADVTVDTGGAAWLTVVNGLVTVTANTTAAPRSASLIVRVTADPSQVKTVAVTQVAGSGVDHSALKYNPLAYVAKYNLEFGGRYSWLSKWDYNHSLAHSYTDSTYIWRWETAKELHKSPRKIDGSTVEYKLPSAYEWYSIVPNTPVSLHFGEGYDPITKFSQTVQVAGQSFNATGDYKSTVLTIDGNTINCHVALRYNGDAAMEKQYRSAWLYYYGPKRVSNSVVKGLIIRCVNIVDIPGISSVDDLNQTFWDTYLAKSVERFFPAAGEYYSSLQYYGVGESGNYWSSSYDSYEKYTGGYRYRAIGVSFSMNGVSCRGSVTHTKDNSTPEKTDNNYLCSVRLFSEKPIE